MSELINRVLIVDLENCPSQLNKLMSDLEKYSHIVICYAQSGAKIPIDWVIPLTTVINSGRLKLVKMPITGKNAADFGITFWAGILSAQLPINTHFDIVSNDTDLDYVISLLIDRQCSAERIGIKKENLLKDNVLTEENETKTLDDYLHEYCLYLSKFDNKPAKKETLLNSINSKFKTDSIDANKLLEMLIKEKIVILNENKVTYNQQKINKFATFT